MVAMIEIIMFAKTPVFTDPSLFLATNRIVQNGNAGARNAK
jgi:hypothetical protein